MSTVAPPFRLSPIERSHRWSEEPQATKICIVRHCERNFTPFGSSIEHQNRIDVLMIHWHAGDGRGAVAKE